MKNYTFVSREDDTWANICILESKYRGIIYNYGKVSVPDENNLDAEGNLPLRFEYTIIETKNIEEEELRKDTDFKNLLGDILVDILNEQLETENMEYKETGLDKPTE